MGNLKYKTYQDKVPYDLIRVLFCASEEDFNFYFRALSDRILETNKDIALYYTDDYESLESEDILTMNLVIVPVTRDFLKPDCKARLFIMNPALDNNIPIIPFEGEAGIELLFNQLVGDLHLLKCPDDDICGHRFLSDLNNEINEKLTVINELDYIKAEFKSFFFVSYRKADVDSLKEVIDNLYQIDFLKDVAIWFDGFLVSGENFNEVINENLLKSRLMILVVTPNVSIGENYVKTIEYPTALNNDIPILPILAKPIDFETFSENYPAISSKLVENNPKALRAALLEYLGDDLLIDDTFYDHNYLIGLAYLYGIYVPKDASKAVSLLEASFSDGFRDAGYVLADIFQNGKYVDRDYLYAVNILVELSGRMLNEDDFDSKEVYLEYLSCVDEVYHILSIFEEYEGAADVASACLKETEEMISVFPSGDDKKTLAKAKRRYLEALSHLPERKEEASKLLKEVYDDYSDLTNEYGYDPDFSIIALYPYFVKIANTDVHSLLMDMQIELLKSFNLDSDEEALRYIGLLHDSISFGIAYIDTLLNNADLYDDSVSVSDYILSEEFKNPIISSIEETISLLAELGHDAASSLYSVKLNHLLGCLYSKYNIDSKADLHLTTAFEICVSCSPDIELTLKNIDIMKDLIKLHKNEMAVQFYYYTRLEQETSDLFTSTGIEKYKEINAECKNFIEKYKNNKND